MSSYVYINNKKKNSQKKENQRVKKYYSTHLLDSEKDKYLFKIRAYFT